MALDQIIKYKQDLVAQKAESIEAMAKNLSKSGRSLKKALSKPRSSFILEIKPASPSKGELRQDVDVIKVAKIYEPFADAISVLADEKFFKGSLDNVRKVSTAVAKPILCKDVIVSALQVKEARFYGADAVLLMLSVLDDETYAECERVASSLDLDVITEVHDEEEMARANRLGAKIIGINNRNLRTLEMDLSNTKRLAPLARKDALVIGESGISMRSQIKNLAGRVDGFLIGSTLMQAPRIDLAVRELIFGRVKICGLTNELDASLAYERGAYYGGLNFVPQSKRFIAVERAASIMKAAPLTWGGVFVNESLDVVHSIAQKLGLDFVQIHGDEDAAYLQSLRSRLPASTEIWRAIRIKGEETQMSAPADRLLLDSHSKLAYGGTGKSFDWGLVRDDPRRMRYVLAGGINAINIKAADELNAFALDIASGAEDAEAPKKSAALLEEIFYKLRP